MTWVKRNVAVIVLTLSFALVAAAFSYQGYEIRFELSARGGQ